MKIIDMGAISPVREGSFEGQKVTSPLLQNILHRETFLSFFLFFGDGAYRMHHCMIQYSAIPLAIGIHPSHPSHDPIQSRRNRVQMRMTGENQNNLL